MPQRLILSICLYNPGSHKRADYLRKACAIILRHQKRNVPAGLVHHIGRQGEETKLMTLEELQDVEADMFTTVFIGNSQTEVIESVPHGDAPRILAAVMGALWIIGGTTEGRELADYAGRKGIGTYVTVATAYGASLIQSWPSLVVCTGRLTEEAMERFLTEHAISLVVDASHPYASVVTDNCRAACMRRHILYIRVARPVSPHRDVLAVYSMEEAAMVLSHTEGNVFLTTGSKNLDVFTHVPSYEKRFYVRILPLRDSLERALSLGYAPGHIICMQGPFSAELNVAMFRQYKARFVVTKDSGKPGGFTEKQEAARMAGARLIVVGRPPETGDSLQSVKARLDALCHKL